MGRSSGLSLVLVIIATATTTTATTATTWQFRSDSNGIYTRAPRQPSPKSKHDSAKFTKTTTFKSRMNASGKNFIEEGSAFTAVNPSRLFPRSGSSFRSRRISCATSRLEDNTARKTAKPKKSIPRMASLLQLCSTKKPETESETSLQDDEEITSSSSPSPLLLETLDKAFEYEGRIPQQPTEQGDGGGEERSPFRSGYVCLVGAPNMGKSTLMNALIQEDLAATTARPQTTRHAILGLLTNTSPSISCQIAFYDTPGVINTPSYKLQQGMMDAVKGALTDADVLLVVTDVFSTPIPSDALFQKIRTMNQGDAATPVLVAINKVDLANSTAMVEQAIVQWRQWLPNALAILPLCAKKKQPLTHYHDDQNDGDNDNAGSILQKQQQQEEEDAGVVALRNLLSGDGNLSASLRALGRPVQGMFGPGRDWVTDEEARSLIPVGPPLYEVDALTDRSERFIASELIRSTLLELLHKELPYCCEVRIVAFKEPKPHHPVIRIKADVVVERESQKRIVVGKGGSQIKAVGMNARLKLQDFFETKVHLELHVKVDPYWRKREDRLKHYGYLK